MPPADDSDSIFPRVSIITPARCDDGDGPPANCLTLDISPSMSPPSPRRAYWHVDFEEATTAAAEFEHELTTDDRSGLSPPPNASSVSVSVCDGHYSGDPEVEADYMEDLEDHDRAMMVMTIAIAKSWQAHANQLMLFSGLLSALLITLLLMSGWAVQPLPPGPWLVCLARVYQLMRNVASTAGGPSKPLPATPPPPPSLLPAHRPGFTMAVPPPPVPPLTQALWLTSLAFSLGCAMAASLLKKRACRELYRIRVEQLLSRWRCLRARSNKGEHAYSGEVGRPLVDMAKFFYAIHACHIVSAVLYLWGISIPLLRDLHPLSSLPVVVGSGAMFFLGQYLIVSSLLRVRPTVQ